MEEMRQWLLPTVYLYRLLQSHSTKQLRSLVKRNFQGHTYKRLSWTYWFCGSGKTWITLIDKHNQVGIGNHDEEVAEKEKFRKKILSKQGDNTNVAGKIMEGTLKRKQVEKYLHHKSKYHMISARKHRTSWSERREHTLGMMKKEKNTMFWLLRAQPCCFCLL